MKINLTKKQYKNLIIMNGVANSIFGILGDVLEGSDYKNRSNEMDELEEYLLQYADGFDCGEFTQEYHGKKIFNDKVYEEKILPTMEDYDDYQLYSDLANKLAWRDFRREHSEKEIEKMRKENGGYFGVELHDYEKKYWDEFDKYEYERLEIKDKNI